MLVIAGTILKLLSSDTVRGECENSLPIQDIVEIESLRKKGVP
jgi:hypothetical protein